MRKRTVIPSDMARKAQYYTVKRAISAAIALNDLYSAEDLIRRYVHELNIHAAALYDIDYQVQLHPSSKYHLHIVFSYGIYLPQALVLDNKSCIYKHLTRGVV